MRSSGSPGSAGPILVTGCSSGIGRETAIRLARAGCAVFASVRDERGADDLRAAGCTVLALDVTDEAAAAAAVAEVEARHGAVGVLVNNAGYGEYGPVETVPLERVRRQFETNVFGAVRLIQLVLPAMRAARRGRIVNVSSMGGRLTFPLGGYYHASKYALEAISDALRVEVAPFGIDVVVIEPGVTRTSFGSTAAHTLAADDEVGAYADAARSVDVRMAASYRSGLFSTAPQRVAATIERAIATPRPRPRYVVSPGAKLLVTVRKVLPDRGWDRLVRRQFGVP